MRASNRPLFHVHVKAKELDMKYIEKHPMIMIIVGILGISMSAIFVRFSTAPSAVTAAFRLLWTVLLMLPAVAGKKEIRKELVTLDKKSVGLSILSGIFLAIHFVLWFESLHHTSVASSTTIVCTEVIWVAFGFCFFMKGKLSKKAIAAIAVTFTGSVVIACADSIAGSSHLYGDILALLGAIAVAVYTLIGRIVRERVSTTVYTFVVYTACAIVLVLTCLAQGYELFTYGTSAMIVGLLLAVFSTILGHSIFSWCLKYFSPAFVSASKLCEPVVSAIFAAILFEEVPSVLLFVGGAMILGGVLYYSRIEGK